MWVNAELHTLATDATTDFVYKSGFSAGTPAYCRYHQIHAQLHFARLAKLIAVVVAAVVYGQAHA